MQVIPVSEVASTLMYYHTAIYNDLLSSIMVYPILSDNASCKIVFPIHDYFWLLFAEVPLFKSVKEIKTLNIHHNYK